MNTQHTYPSNTNIADNKNIQTTTKIFEFSDSMVATNSTIKVDQPQSIIHDDKVDIKQGY